MDQDTSTVSVGLPNWYESTTGPRISMTLINLAGTLIPTANFFLASYHINVLPSEINPWITLAVFLWFAARAAYGYIRSKTALLRQIGSIRSTNAILSKKLASITSSASSNTPESATNNSSGSAS